MRLLAFSLLAAAALDAWVPFVDRAGAALLGLGCIALALPPRPRRIRRPAMLRVPPQVVPLPDVDDEREELADDAPLRRWLEEGLAR